MLAEAYIGAKQYAEAVEAYCQIANASTNHHMKKIAQERIREALQEGNLAD